MIFIDLYFLDSDDFGVKGLDDCENLLVVIVL